MCSSHVRIENSAHAHAHAHALLLVVPSNCVEKHQILHSELLDQHLLEVESVGLVLVARQELDKGSAAVAGLRGFEGARRAAVSRGLRIGEVQRVPNRYGQDKAVPHANDKLSHLPYVSIHTEQVKTP